MSTLSVPVASYTVQLAGDGPPQAASIVSVVVSGPDTVNLGGSAQLTATAVYTDGSVRDVTTVAKWSPALPPLVSVSPGGLVVGYITGATVVSASLDTTIGSPALTVIVPPK